MRSPTWRVVGSATTGHQGIEEFLSVRPDVTLMDLGFRDMSGIDVIAAIRRESPDARIVVLTIPRPQIEHNPLFLPIATAERQRQCARSVSDHSDTAPGGMFLPNQQRPLRSHPTAQACAVGLRGCRGHEFALDGML
jgi:CheY-like chemotaxis protein